jgi:thiol:disulfide interchange protein DsbD
VGGARLRRRLLPVDDGNREVRSGWSTVRRGFGALGIVYGTLLLIGALAGRNDPLQPLAGTQGLFGGGSGGANAAEHADVTFKRIKSVADLQGQLAAAHSTGKPVMLDFYADWCVSCKEMERHTFIDPAVQQALAAAVLLQADVTANDATDQQLLQYFGILGPPTIVFYDSTGAERPQFRVVGFKSAKEFAPHVRQAFAAGDAA